MKPLFFLILLLVVIPSCSVLQKSASSRGSVHTVLEVDAATINKGHLVGWQEDSSSYESAKNNWMIPYQGGRSCAFQVQQDGEKTDIFRRFNPKYTWSGNPSVLAMTHKKLIVVCMSAQAPFLGAGILEIKYSSDAGGTWSDWVSVYETQKGSADKPVLYKMSSNRFGLAFVKFNASPDKFIEVKGKRYQENKLRGQLYDINFDFSGIHPKILKTNEVHLKEFVTLATGTVSGHYTTEVIGLPSGASVGILTGRHKDDSLYFLQKKVAGKWGAKKLFSTDIDAPICRMSAKNNNLIAAVCYEAHAHKKVVVFLTMDGGDSWTDPLEIDPKGSLAALSFGSSELLTVVWQKLAENKILFKAASFSTKLKKIKERTLLGLDRPSREEHFVGAFQDVHFDRERNQFNFFGAGVEWSATPEIIHRKFSE